MISYGRQNIDKSDINEVVKVLKSDWLTQGPKVLEFEKALAKYCGAKYAVAVSNGTAALHLSYLAVGLKKGDEVITTPNTFAATSNMLLAVGAKYKNNKIGSCKYSDMVVFSFHPVKPITTGEGGAILTNNKKYYNKLVSLRSHGIHKNKYGKNVMDELGYNYRLTDIQAALGISQLKKLDGFINKRQKVVEWYKKELGDVENIILPKESPDNYSGWHIYVIRTKKRKDRDKLMSHLKKKNIGVNFHYPAVYSHPYYRKIGYNNIKLENMEEYHNTCVTLPCHTKLIKNDIQYIVKLITIF